MRLLRELGTAIIIATLASCNTPLSPPTEPAPDRITLLEERVQQVEQQITADEARYNQEITALKASNTALRTAHDNIMRAYRAEQREDLLAIRDLSEDQYAIVRAYVTGNLRTAITPQTSAADIICVQGEINQLKPRLRVEFATETAEAILADKEYQLLVQLYERSDEQTQAYVADCVDKTLIRAARANRLPKEDASRLCEELYTQESQLGQRFGGTYRRLLEDRAR